MLLEKGKLNGSLILNSYSIKQQIVPINIYFTGSTDLIRSFLEEKDDIIDLCNDKTKVDNQICSLTDTNQQLRCDVNQQKLLLGKN